MGCWNEAEARQRFEDALKRKLEAQKAKEAEEARRTGASLNGSINGIAGGGQPTPRKTSTTLFDANLEDQKQRKLPQRLSVPPRQGPVDSGFDAPTLVTSGPISPTQTSFKDPVSALKVFTKVRSIRGFARQEYGNIYGALAPFYYDLAKSQSHIDPILFRTYREPEQQAQMLSQLKKFAKSDWATGWNQREEKLDSMVGIFENAVLREFETGMQVQDIDGRMRKYAHVLVILDGGAAGVDTFIQNDRIMAQKETLGNPLHCLDYNVAGGLTLAPAQEFFRGLATGLNEQISVIDRVFPPSVDVLRPFIERVAEDVISEYVTTLFDEAHDRSIEAYLRAVAGVFEQALRFAISIKRSKGSKPDFAKDIKQLIGKCFEPHIDLYLQEELDFFKQNSEKEVDAWEKRLTEEAASKESFFMSNINRQADKRDFLTSFKKVIMMPVSIIPFTSSSSSKPEKPTPTVNGNSLAPTPRSSTPVPGERSGSPVPEAPTTELAAKAAIMNSRLEGIKTLFSIEVALNLVHTAKASLERAALFVQLGGQSGEEAREQCETIFVVLLQILGTRHIKPGFDKAVLHLSAYNPREISEHGQAGVEPLVTFLELVNVGDLIQQMIDVFYAQELVAQKLSDRDDFLSPAENEKKKFEQMLDERVAAGLNKGIDVLMDEVEYICATRQKPTDFNPGAGKGVDANTQIVDLGPSETATRVVTLVSSHVGMLVGSTEKQMLDVFNQEVGVRLFTALCKHIKRQRISVDGAITLIRYSPFPPSPNLLSDMLPLATPTITIRTSSPSTTRL
jgi:recyclin-1